MSKAKFATIWLDGCSGCHMSFLDIDERILELAARVDVVYSPLVDFKEYPDNVDIALIEGAVSTDEDIHKAKMIRSKTKIIISYGDCATTGNVPAMRNKFTVKSIFDRAYFENAHTGQQVPASVVPTLLDRVMPLHEVIPVDVHIPGCPPSADTIFNTLVALLDGKEPEITKWTRFGA